MMPLFSKMLTRNMALITIAMTSIMPDTPPPLSMDPRYSFSECRANPFTRNPSVSAAL